MAAWTRRSVAVCTLALSMAFGAHAAVGIGFHWGFDWSLRMDDVTDEHLILEDLRLDVGAVDLGTLPGVPAGFGSEITGEDLPIFIDRTGFDRTVVNFGGKLLLDMFDKFELELSTNIGVWEYEASIAYPVGLTFTGADPQTTTDVEDLYDITYTTLPLTLKEFGLSYWGLDKTPYAKLHFDLSLRKTFLALPKKLKTFSLYAGAGASMHFATPVLSAALIDRVLSDELGSAFATLGSLDANLLGNPDVMEAILMEIIAGLSEPKFGMHILAGTQFKLPVVPIAFYVDGKLMIPFGEMDSNVDDLDGVGFLVNAGIMLKF
jgi:hypothetical protein